MSDPFSSPLLDFVEPLSMNGLDGRMLKVRSQKAPKREILLIYGHHALIERWFSLVENLSDYGNVTMADLPGFGGMTKFAKIHQRPTIDAYADYLASFIKLHYKRKKFVIVGISFGFVIATRMLQKYPELSKQVTLVVSLVGFMHKDDFQFKPRNRIFFTYLARVFALHPVSFFIRYAALNTLLLRFMYKTMPASKARFIDAEPLEFTTMLNFEVVLWHANDVRTHWMTTSEFLKLDNCKTTIDLPVWHVASKADYYFDNDIVKQHMLVVYNSYEEAYMDTKAHTPNVLADKQGMAVMLPPGLRKALAKL